MPVIATAGHVDHGKSALVKALTGMEPDRLAEERRRGLTIELGHCWTTLPGARQPTAFVDVPGHERFLSTMLAGVGPVPAVLLVVAADGGWSAQTTEHLAALEALGVARGVVTGTLAAGTLAVGEELELVGRTGAQRVRVRGLQSLGRPQQQVTAVVRVAVNLRGVQKSAVDRGDALLTPGHVTSTDVLRGRLVTAPDGRLPTQLRLHVGAAAVPIRVRRRDGAGVRLALDHALPLLPGDRGVLTDPGRRAVVSGLVVDPPPLAPERPAAREPAPTPLPAHLQAAVAQLTALDQPFTVRAARVTLGLTRPDVLALLEELDAAGATRRIAGNARVLTPGSDDVEGVRRPP